jgi:hypothetical protein
MGKDGFSSFTHLYILPCEGFFLLDPTCDCREGEYAI